MIKIVKESPEPQVLTKKRTTWVAEFKAEFSAAKTAKRSMKNAIRFRYRHKDIKNALLRESFEKCVYCESNPRHVCSGQTDHFVPISKANHDQIYDWDNLVFCCRICNENKDDYTNIHGPLVHPIHDDPEEYIRFAGEYALQCKYKDTKGPATIRQLELNRDRLIERRRKVIEELNETLLELYEERDTARRQWLLTELRDAVHQRAEYSATARCFIRHVAGIHL